MWAFRASKWSKRGQNCPVMTTWWWRRVTTKITHPSRRLVGLAFDHENIGSFDVSLLEHTPMNWAHLSPYFKSTRLSESVWISISHHWRRFQSRRIHNSNPTRLIPSTRSAPYLDNWLLDWGSPNFSQTKSPTALPAPIQVNWGEHATSVYWSLL